MKLIPTWPIAALCLALGVAGGAVATRGVYVGQVAERDSQISRVKSDHKEELRQREAQRVRDEVAARNEERRLAQRAGKIEQDKNDEISTIRARHADELGRLQERANRKPAATGGVPRPAPACEGSTGTELSRQDAGFLAGEAARGDELRAALSACYRAYDSVGH